VFLLCLEVHSEKRVCSGKGVLMMIAVEVLKMFEGGKTVLDVGFVA
jgi:hypothetical protein